MGGGGRGHAGCQGLVFVAEKEQTLGCMGLKKVIILPSIFLNWPDYTDVISIPFVSQVKCKETALFAGLLY